MRGVVHVTHHLLLLTEEGADLPPYGGLVAAGDRCAAVYTGIHTGVVEVSLHVLSGPPAGVEDGADGWEETAEVSVPAGGPLVLATALDGPVPGFPAVPAYAGSARRIRVHASGRSGNVDGVATVPTERYLIEGWPAG